MSSQDGWIEWDGEGRWPEGLEFDDYVSVRYRSGDWACGRARGFNWSEIWHGASLIYEYKHIDGTKELA